VTLLDLGPEIMPLAALGDNGYGSKANRQAARARGIWPAIPYRANAKEQPRFFPKALCRGRARIEETIGKLKRFKRVALRCEKTDQNYRSFAPLLWSLSSSNPIAWTPLTDSMWQDSGCCRIEKEVSMEEISSIGLDLAKNVFQVHGVWMRDLLGMSDDLEGLRQSARIGWLVARVGQSGLGGQAPLHDLLG
jgi:DDE family transposase